MRLNQNVPLEPKYKIVITIIFCILVVILGVLNTILFLNGQILPTTNFVSGEFEDELAENGYFILAVDQEDAESITISVIQNPALVKDERLEYAVVISYNNTLLRPSDLIPENNSAISKQTVSEENGDLGFRVRFNSASHRGQSLLKLTFAKLKNSNAKIGLIASQVVEANEATEFVISKALEISAH